MPTYKPNFITRLVTSAVMATSVIFGAVPAEAQEVTRGTIRGYRAAVIESGSMYRPDFIEIVGPYGTETIKVTCSPYDWSSNGPNNAGWVNSIANEWCYSANSN